MACNTRNLFQPVVWTIRPSNVFLQNCMRHPPFIINNEKINMVLLKDHLLNNKKVL
jgi:hypothetical protein